uniref:CCHC-type domain-containing protein n=1 Tax=Tanacetum cinerariifolium TaxID=118510 RepID=A0A6L2J8G5_TANCI|nr:hypothetical protein [Tanacetum cinerariifolium]
MAGNTMKDMTTNFRKLDKFEGHDFRRWQKKMHFLLTTLMVVYVLTTPMPELLEDATVEELRIREKWENNDYICKGHILNGMSDSFLMHKRMLNQLRSCGIHSNPSTWQRMLRVRSSGNFNKKPKLECWKCGKTGHFKRDCRSGKKSNANAGGSGKGSKDQSQDQDRCWFKTYEPVEDGSVLYMGDDHFAPIHGKGSVALEFSSGKTITLFNVFYVPKHRFGYYNNGMFMLNLNKVRDDSNSVYMSSSTVVNSSLWHARLGHVHYKRMLEMSKDDLILAIDENLEKYTTCMLMKRLGNHFKGRSKLPNPKMKTLGEKGIDCIFVGYAEHSKAYRDDHSDDVSSETLEPRRGKRARKAKSYGSDFQLYLVEGSRDQVGSQYSYCYNIEEDLRTYNEATQSRDATLWKEVIDDEISSIIENNTWVLSDLPSGCKPLGYKWIFKRKMKVDRTIDKFKARLVIKGFKQKEWIDYFDTCTLVARITTIRLLLALAAIHNLVSMKQPEGFLCQVMSIRTDQNIVDKTKKFLSSRFFMKDMREANVILGIKIKRENKGIVITPSHYIEKILKKFNREDCSSMSTLMVLVEKLKPNTSKPMDQLEYSRAISCLMYAMTSTRLDIAYAVGRLSRGGAISWASKKQTCITGSTIESESVALAVAGKEAEWLRNLIHEILIWSKPITPISIHCDSAATLAKAYSQMYNGKSRHLGVRHSMIKELIMNGVISIEFVRSQQNLADHLTKGLARDLVNKSVIRM